VGRRPKAPSAGSAAGPVSIDAALTALTAAAAQYLGAVDQRRSAATRSVTERRTGVAAQADRDRAIVRNQVDAKARQAVDRISEACASLVPGPRGATWSSPEWEQLEPAILETADYVRCGEVELDQGPIRVTNDALRAPMVVPLLNCGNLVVVSRSGNPAATVTLQQVALRALSSTGPGQLTLLSVDPQLRGVASPFSGLRAGGEELVPPSCYSEEQVSELLAKLTADVQRVTDLFRGRPVTLSTLRAETGQPIEHFRLVIVSDFPNGFDQRSFRLLTTLLENGPRCGISFVVHHAHDAKPLDGVEPGAIHRHSTVIDLDRATVTHPTRAGLRWQPEPPPPLPLVESAASKLGELARHAAAPSVEFGTLHDHIPRWTASSAERITAVIGRAGHQPVEITLGDSREQRHNILVSGAVGQGKSNLLLVLIHSFAVRYGPSELEMYLLDLKDGMTLAPLSAPDSFLPHAKVLGLQSDREFAVAVLQHLVREFERRAPVMRDFGDNIERFRAARPDVQLPRILLVIDEFQTLFEEDDAISQEAMQCLERLAKKGRAYGIHIILGSQTLSGITPLLAKQDGIFAQFPIRLALKNTPNESRVVLDSQNVEASRLRYRGEAVVNLDFGSVEGNQRAVIAAADLDELRVLRTNMVSAADAPAPSIYDGAAAAHLDRHTDAVRRLRHRTSNDGFRALIGRRIDVAGSAVEVPMGPENGRHLAIIGAGQPVRDTDDQRDDDLAIGVLQSAALSLALQDRALAARFVVLDQLPDEQRRRARLDQFLEALSSFGAQIDVLSAAEVPTFLRQMTSEVAARTPGEGPMFLIGFGMDRCSEMDVADMSFVKPSEGLHTVLRDGGARHVHLLAHWQTLRSYTDHLGFNLSGAVGALLALRIQQTEIVDLMGAQAKWQPRDNRGLFLDSAYSEAPETIIPFAPPSAKVIEQLQLTTWDG
jgi:hypothetical protein